MQNHQGDDKPSEDGNSNIDQEVDAVSSTPARSPRAVLASKASTPAESPREVLTKPVHQYGEANAVCTEVGAHRPFPYSDLAAKERKALAALLGQCTSKLEKDLRQSLQMYKLALEDSIPCELERIRTQRPEDRVLLPAAQSDPDPADPDFQNEARSNPTVRFTTHTSWQEEQHAGPMDSINSQKLDRPGSRKVTTLSRVTAASRDSIHSARKTSGMYREALIHRMQSLERVFGGRGKEMPKEADRKSQAESPQQRHRRLRASLRFLRAPSVIHGTMFNLLSAALILGNAIFIGVQTHIGIQNEFQGIEGEKQDISWETPELLFLAFFTAELTIRIRYDKLSFFRGVEWRWNLFDSAIVGLSLIETVAASILSGVGLKFPFLRLVRVVRVLRVLKVLHMIPFFKRLGLMMHSVAASLSALAPAFVLLILVMYMYGICVMQGIINHIESNPVQQMEDWLAILELRFGRISQTMSTLFMSITGGISWVEVLDGLNQIDGVYNLIYMFYVGFVQICVLNIVTGVFVDTVHQMYQPEREEMVERETSKRKIMLQNLKALLEEADEDGSGSITWTEFEQFTNDVHIQMYLAAHEIDITQAKQIFELIDGSGTGEVSIDEFVLSFMAFKGAAKGADVVIMRNDIQKIVTKVIPWMVDTTKTMEDMKKLVQTLASMSPHLSDVPHVEDTERVILPSVGGKGGSGHGLGKSGHVPPTYCGRGLEGDTMPYGDPS
mmetsp:Transcript_71428/g.172906  ORF Transcript_71428/g.172906 Transcript_71428/m.172906 type:complete len:726 (+) Transcript_71428:89-2266(+)